MSAETRLGCNTNSSNKIFTNYAVCPICGCTKSTEVIGNSGGNRRCENCGHIYVFNS